MELHMDTTPPLPTAPSRSDPENFANRANEFLLALATFQVAAKK